MAKTTAKTDKSRTGTLRIGNQWNAINIIARSQTHPLKAVCELTENAIDAKAKHVQIVRRRSKGQVFLEVIDDGQGVVANEEGEPDFARIATHVCDSMKRHLDAKQRHGVHGEFGIGLLSFWSLGEQLRMMSPGQGGRLFEMQLTRGKRDYSVRPVRGRLATDGTRVIVGPLLESTRKIVTGEKLVRYLSTELRDRIRSSGVRVRMLDRISRKDLAVEPREFEGERVSLPPRVSSTYGDLTVELYFREGPATYDTGVAVCKDGTRVLKDVTELVQLQRPPWTDGRVEGVLDYAPLGLSPGTRSGIVPDEKLTTFIEAVQSLETPLSAAIEERDQAETDKASQQILKQVHRAFINALRELPSNEYLFFDIPQPKHPVGDKSAGAGGSGENQDGVPLRQQAAGDADKTDDDDDGPEPELLPLEPGPLASVRIKPRHARRRPGQDCQLVAVARDQHGIAIAEGVQYEWRIVEGDGLLAPENQRALVRCELETQLVVEVCASQQHQTATDQVVVKFLQNISDGDQDSAKGLPSYRLEPEHGKPWRSRYDGKENEIIINSAHRDFLSSRSTGAKHRRYIGKLYAKEVVLINFPHESPGDVMERLIELTLRTEDVL